jgi:hypothetical protein
MHSFAQKNLAIAIAQNRRDIWRIAEFSHFGES